MVEPRRVVSDSALSPGVVDAVRDALVLVARDGDASVLDAPLRAACLDARLLDLPPEQIVLALKRVWRGTTPPGILGAMDWDSVYRVALTRALTLFFEMPRP